MVATDILAPSAAPTSAAVRRNQATWWVPLGAPGFVAAVVFMVARRGLVDDAYITLDFARTLALHGVWGVSPAETANTQTSVLNASVLAGLTVVLRSVLVAAGIVWIGSMAGVGGFTAAIARRLGWSRWAGPAAGLGCATSPLLASTIGLETGLAVALLAALAWATVSRRAVCAGVVGALLVLTRPDLALFTFLGVVLAGRAWWRTGLIAALGVVPWTAASWLLFGSAVPDTLFIKAGSSDGWFHRYLWLNSPLMYWRFWPAETAALIPLAAAGLVVAGWWLCRAGPRRRLAILLGGGAVAYWTAMWALSTPGSHWYYAITIMPLTLLAVLAAATEPRGGRWPWSGWRWRSGRWCWRGGPPRGWRPR